MKYYDTKDYDTITEYIGFIEFDGDVLHFEQWWTTCNDGKKYNHRLKAGFSFVTDQFTQKFDTCFSLDENLQQFFEKIEVKNKEN